MGKKVHFVEVIPSPTHTTNQYHTAYSIYPPTHPLRHTYMHFLIREWCFLWLQHVFGKVEIAKSR